MDFAHFADDTGPDQFAEAAGVFGGLALVAHLGGDFCLAGSLCEEAGFVDGVGEGFLAVNVFAALDGLHGGEGVPVVGGGDHHGVDLFDIIQHLSEVSELASLGVAFEGVSRVGLVNVTEGYDVFAFELPQIGCPLAADADARDVELAARGILPAQIGDESGECKGPCGGS